MGVGSEDMLVAAKKLFRFHALREAGKSLREGEMRRERKEKKKSPELLR